MITKIKHKAEYFQLLSSRWDVAKAFQMIINGKHKHKETIKCPVDAWYNSTVSSNDPDAKGFDLLHVSIDVKHAMSNEVDTDVPLLFIMQEIEGKEYPLMIDGHHRLYRAYKNGIETMDAYVLSIEEADSIYENLL